MPLVFKYDLGITDQPVIGDPIPVILDLASNNGMLLAGCSDQYVRRWNLAGASSLASVATPHTPDAIAMADSVNLACLSFNSTTPFLVNTSSGAVTSLTATSACYQSGKGQQIAGIVSSNVAMGTSATAGSVNLINSSLVTSNLITVTGLGSAHAVTVIAKPSSAHWLIGTNDGRVMEVDQSGAVSNTITLPTTPNCGTPPVHIVSGMSMANGNLLVSTLGGTMFAYTYPSTLVQTLPLGLPTGTTGWVMTPSANGLTALFPSYPKSAGGCVNMIDFATSPLRFVDYFYGPENDPIVAGGFDATTSSLYFGLATKVRVINCNMLNTSTYTDHIQNPNGTDVSARSIIMHYPKQGMAKVVADETIASGQQTVTVPYAGEEYISIVLRGTPFSTELVDVRRVTT